MEGCTAKGWIGGEGAWGVMDKVEIACLFNPPPGVLDECKQLKAVQSLGAGVDFLMADDTIPKHLPLMRIVDPLMAERMATFCVWAVRGD